MAKANLTLEARGVDKTGAAFNSVKNRAKSTGASIRAAFASAFAAAGAYLGVRSIVNTVNELSRLSDIAQKTGASVDELTKASTAFGVVGLKGMNPEGLARAFAYMERQTGRTGMAGFYQTVEEIGRIPDAAKRSQEAMRVFGRMGLEFTPLIEGARDGVDAIRTVCEAMPSIPQSAADAGDAVSDSLSMLTAQMKSIWAQGVGFMCQTLDDGFTGGVRESMLLAGAYIEYYIKSAVAKCISYFRQMQTAMSAAGAAVGGFFGALSGGASFGEAWDMAGEAWKQEAREFDEIDAAEKARLANFEANLEKRKAAISKFGDAYKELVDKMNKANRKATPAPQQQANREPRVRNDLILGGSNAANLLAVLGPQTQSETKRQTSLLQRIAENTEATTAAVEGIEGEDFRTVE